MTNDEKVEVLIAGLVALRGILDEAINEIDETLEELE
jgi:hypothetical protein